MVRMWFHHDFAVKVGTERSHFLYLPYLIYPGLISEKDHLFKTEKISDGYLFDVCFWLTDNISFLGFKVYL